MFPPSRFERGTYTAGEQQRHQWLLGLWTGELTDAGNGNTGELARHSGGSRGREEQFVVLTAMESEMQGGLFA